MRGKYILLRAGIWALAVFLAAPLSANAQSAQVPSLPHYFYGTLKIDGADAPAGTTIEAMVTGALKDPSFNPITTTQSGSYGSASSTASVPRLLVQGDIIEGAIIQFYVNNRQADQTAAWHGGQVTVLNLSVNTAIPPSLAVVTGSASNIDFTEATVSGTLTQTGDAQSVAVSFQFGTTQVYGSETSIQTMTTNGAFSATLHNLIPDTLYHYRAKAAGGGTVVYGADGTFRTQSSQGIILPMVATGAASSVNSTSAVLNGTLLQMNGPSSVFVSFRWGATSAYGNETPTQNLAASGAFNATLTGLQPDTLYHFQAKAVGTITAFGVDQTFRTTAATTAGSGSGGGAAGGGGTAAGGAATGGAVAVVPVGVSGLSGTPPAINTVGATTTTSAMLTTTDGKVSISVPSGTTMRTSAGTALTTLSASPSTTAPLPQVNHSIVVNYLFGPDGATFSPPITITMTYAEERIPAGVNEADLFLAFWDGSQWVELTSSINAQNNTITGQVSHFTNIAVISPLATPLATPPQVVTVPVPVPAPGTTPPPESSPAPLPAAETIPVPQETPSGGFNWTFAIVVMAAIIIVLAIMFLRAVYWT